MKLPPSFPWAQNLLKPVLGGYLIKEFLICSKFKPMLIGYLIKESLIYSEVQANVGWPFDYKKKMG
jgi:hypothetical protein